MKKSDIDHFFDRIFIINLESMVDRRKRMEKELSRYGIKNYEFFAACRPDNINDYPKSYIANFSEKLIRINKKYSYGALGCKLSHYKIIQQATQKGLKKILILEDDCIFIKNAMRYYWPSVSKQLQNQINQWQMFYFSGNMHSQPNMVTEYISQASETYTTHSYALDLSNTSFTNDLLENMLDSGLEVDSFYVKKIQTNQFYKTYIAIPALSTQADGFSSIRQGNKSYSSKIFKHGEAINQSLTYKIGRFCLRFLKKNSRKTTNSK